MRIIHPRWYRPTPLAHGLVLLCEFIHKNPGMIEFNEYANMSNHGIINMFNCVMPYFLFLLLRCAVPPGVIIEAYTSLHNKFSFDFHLMTSSWKWSTNSTVDILLLLINMVSVGIPFYAVYFSKGNTSYCVGPSKWFPVNTVNQLFI